MGHDKHKFTDSFAEISEHKRKVARSLATKLQKEFKEYDKFSQDLLSVKLGMKYQVLGEDTIGLLEGIASGNIQTSQPRIASNLAGFCEGIEALGENYIDDCYSFAEMLKEASAAGLTADNNGVELARRDHQKIR